MLYVTFSCCVCSKAGWEILHDEVHVLGTGPSNAGHGGDMSAPAGYMEMMASTEQAQAQAQAQALAAPDGYGNSHPGMPTANGPAGDPSTSQQACPCHPMHRPARCAMIGDKQTSRAWETAHDPDGIETRVLICLEPTLLIPLG